MEIGIYFEKENINTLDAAGELLFTILSSLAQDESRSISENCKWGIRKKFRDGILHLNPNRFMGYDKDENGRLVINEEQATIVKRIFYEFMNDLNPDVIARRLRDRDVWERLNGRLVPSLVCLEMRNIWGMHYCKSLIR